MVVNKSQQSTFPDDDSAATGGIHVDDGKATERLHPVSTTTADRLQADCEMVIRKALEALPIATKVRRLQGLWPLIEQKLLAGTSHSDILRALNDGGFDLSERTYKTYVYRFRKRQRRRHLKTKAHPPATRPHAPPCRRTHRAPIPTMTRRKGRRRSTSIPAVFQIYSSEV